MRHYNDPAMVSQYATGSPRNRRLTGGQDITYIGAHARLWSTRGKASTHDCVGCGGPAREWALRWRDIPTHRIKYGHANDPRSGRVAPYSPEPLDYDPRCRRCHNAYDEKLGAKS